MGDDLQSDEPDVSSMPRHVEIVVGVLDAIVRTDKTGRTLMIPTAFTEPTISIEIVFADGSREYLMSTMDIALARQRAEGWAEIFHVHAVELAAGGGH